MAEPELKYLVDDIPIPENEIEHFKKIIQYRHEQMASDPEYKAMVDEYVRINTENGRDKNFGPDKPFLCPAEARNYFDVKDFINRPRQNKGINPRFKGMKFTQNGKTVSAEEMYASLNKNQGETEAAHDNHTGAPKPGENGI